MARRLIPGSGRRVPIALALMGLVLGLLGFQQARGDLSARGLGAAGGAPLALASSSRRS